MKRRIYYIGTMVIVVAVLLALWIYAEGPMSEHRYCICEVCRAKSDTSKYLGIPLPRRTEMTSFGGYYLQNIDPDHRHSWGCYYISRNYRFPRKSLKDRPKMGGHATVIIPDDMLLAIIRSLPDRPTRLAFCEQFRSPNCNRGHFVNSIYSLRDSWDSNPRKSDWPKVLRQVRLYPKVR